MEIFAKRKIFAERAQKGPQRTIFGLLTTSEKKRLEIVLKTNEILVTRRLHVPRSTSVDSQRIKAMQMDIYTYVCVGWYVCDDHTFSWNNIRCAHGDEHTLEKRSMMRGTNTHSYVRFEYYVFIVLCIIMVGDSFAVVWLKI